mgnify:CR=1 FL=1
MSQINVRNLSNENDDGAPDIVGVSTLSATSYFIPPVGTTKQRPENPQPGDLRFNTDTSSLEYYRGEIINWEQIEMTSPDHGGVLATSFYDSSSYGRTVTAVGDISHSTVQKKVGGSSIRRNANYSCIHVPDSSDFDWGTNDWTMECWIRRDAQGGDEWLMAHSDGTGANTSIGLHIWSTQWGGSNANMASIRFRQSGGNVDCNGTTVLAANTWYHIAGVRDGNTLRIYVNGVQEGTTSISGSPDTSSAAFAMTALRTNGDSGLTGYMDEIRVSKSCRYTSGTTFTPSTTPFTSDSNTLILIHSDLGVESGAGVGPRGVFAGGYTDAASPYPSCNIIDYVTITTLGNSNDFGDLIQAGTVHGAAASRTRGLFYGNNGGHTGATTSIDYITISSTGNAADFGDSSESRGGSGDKGCASQTRGLFGGGATYSPTSFKDTIDYVTIASTGNAKDFGNLTTARSSIASLASSTRGVWGGGYNPSNLNVIDYVTITTTGDATDFGDMAGVHDRPTACANSTRGLFMGGQNPNILNTIQYITIATKGDASDFGDLTQACIQQSASASPTRALRVGGNTPGDNETNTIDYVEIATTGNATDFGDLATARYSFCGVSNAHGGL